MNWSGGALKATVGAGGMIAAALYWDWTDPEVSGPFDLAFIAPMIVAFGPFILLLMVRSGEVSDRVLRVAHLIAVIWYALLAVGTAALMAYRGFQPVDALLGAFLLAGFAPCIAALRALHASKNSDPV